jgi:hypothetical protein
MPAVSIQLDLRKIGTGSPFRLEVNEKLFRSW